MNPKIKHYDKRPDDMPVEWPILTEDDMYRGCLSNS